MGFNSGFKALICKVIDVSEKHTPLAEVGWKIERSRASETSASTIKLRNITENCEHKYTASRTPNLTHVHPLCSFLPVPYSAPFPFHFPAHVHQAD